MSCKKPKKFKPKLEYGNLLKPGFHEIDNLKFAPHF